MTTNTKIEELRQVHEAHFMATGAVLIAIAQRRLLR